MGIVKRLDLWQAEIIGSGNLEIAHQHLKIGSVIGAFNHPFPGDVLWTLVTCLQALQNNTQHLLTPVAMGQIDFKRALRDLWRGKQQTRTQALNVLRNCFAFRGGAWSIGAESIPVIQPFDMGIYGRKETRTNWEYLFGRGTEMLTKPGTLLVISPEGDRSRDGQLQRAGRGFVALWERAGPDCLCLPLGVSLQGQSQGLNIRGEVMVQAGPPVRLQDMSSNYPGERISAREEKEITDTFMRDYLAPLLPPEQRGYYQRW